jgi:Bacterial Ig domain
MQYTLRRLATRLTIILALAAPAWSQCNAPSSPGAVICNPTNGSTVVYPPEISMRSTPAQGAHITQFRLYDNGVDVFDGPPGDSGVNLYDGSIYNGFHHFVMNAWDSDGHLYQASTSVTITGQGFGLCSMPKSPGINFCNPPSSALLPTNVQVNASATGASPIKSISFYVNGKLAQTVTNSAPNGNSFGVGVAVQLPKQGVAYTITASATDSSGHTYSASRTLTGRYTYTAYGCAPKGNQCFPGINVISPGGEAYVGSTFNINAQILDNPKPITRMKAYLDGTVVATSSNGTLQHEVSTQLEGTHILTIQGWDDSGIEYRVQQDININVHE